MREGYADLGKSVVCYSGEMLHKSSSENSAYYIPGFVTVWARIARLSWLCVFHEPCVCVCVCARVRAHIAEKVERCINYLWNIVGKDTFNFPLHHHSSVSWFPSPRALPLSKSKVQTFLDFGNNYLNAFSHPILNTTIVIHIFKTFTRFTF